MVELMQKYDFSEGALSIGGMLKRIEYFLEGHNFGVLVVGHLPDMSVSPAAKLLDERIPPEHVSLNFLRHFRFLF